MSDAVVAKVRKLREEYETQGYEVVERPAPEEFPFDAGYRGFYRPAMLARRGDENIVFDVREEIRGGLERLIDQFREIRRHPGWDFYLVTCEDVVPLEAPGVQGDPPDWGWLEQHADEARSLAETGPKRIALLALWSVLEGMLRRASVDHEMPTDRLPGALLLPMLYDEGYLPFETYEPLKAAQEVHRRVVHGYDAPEPKLTEAVRSVADALPKILAENLQHAS
ncbi:MAG: hypothetical protein JO306_03340 [Gemmatimonadetes bacterium]|nr:hypothetical protein [Gemmatimonadota bacterium]